MTACGSGSTNNSTTKAAANKQILVTTVPTAGTQDIATMDPALATDLPSGDSLEPVFTGLVSLNDAGSVQAQMASSWDVSADKLTYTFHLKPNLKFSDGTPLTATDVAYSINRALDPATQSPTAPYYLRYIKDATTFNSGKIKTLIGDSLIVVNDSTLEIKLSQPISFFLYTLTYPCSFVVEKSLITKYGNQWINHLDQGGGDGPFKVVKWTHNVGITYVPNPDYYGPQPQLKELEETFYGSADATSSDYLAGKVDDATVPLADYASYSKRPDFYKSLLLQLNSYAMNFNMPPFNNIDIRKAIDLAINKQQITSKIWYNSMLPTNHMIPQGMIGYNPNLKGPDGTTSVTGNPTMAKQLLQEGMKQEGWTSVKQIPSITLTTVDSGIQAQKEESAVIQQDIQDVLGIHINIETVTFDTWLSNTGKGSANPYQFYWYAWIADYGYPEDWTSLLFEPGASNNNMNYGQNHSSDAAAQQAVQKEMTQADTTSNQTQALAMYDDIEQKLVNDVTLIPMEQAFLTVLRKPCVQGVQPNPMEQTPPDDWAKVYISTASCANVSIS
jgi:peptide/nickel transport system substrate-binding protein/oligopeptide transport system substrate-binding protein